MAKRYDPILCMMVDEPTKAQDANTLYETFAHGNSKHAGVLEMNGKVKVVVWNEGDNPRTGKVTVIGEDTPANRSKAKSMLDSAKAKDESYVVRGRKYKVVKRDGDNVTVLGPDGKVTKMDIDFLMSEGKKVSDSASALDEAIKVCDASTGHKVVVFVENYLRSIGKNNSTGKYDKIVQGVRSLLSESLLDDDGLKKAAEHEADRLLKKYNL